MCELNQLRQEAITKLRQSSEVNSEYCLVGKTKVTNTEKNKLLKD